MKRIAVLSGLSAEFYNFLIKPPKPTGKTVFLILLLVLCNTKIYSQSERFVPGYDTIEIEHRHKQDSLDGIKHKQDSLGDIKQKLHILEDDTESEIQLRKIRERIKIQKYWRGALIYSSIALAVILLVAIFTLNYYQGRRKSK